jgi:hypothetical protein
MLFAMSQAPGDGMGGRRDSHITSATIPLTEVAAQFNFTWNLKLQSAPMATDVPAHFNFKIKLKYAQEGLRLTVGGGSGRHSISM